MRTMNRGVLLVAAIVALPAMVHGQQAISLQALIQETQKVSEAPNELTIVWWLPEDFWRVSFSQDPSVPPAQVEEFLSVIRPYTIVGIIDGKIGPLGGVTFSRESDVRNSVFLTDIRGRRFAPLRDSEVNADTRVLLQLLKPMLTGMAGPMGENMHFIVFRGVTPDGRAVANPTSQGVFSVSVMGNEFSFRLPLGSLLPQRYDPSTLERFPGNYNYNPYTGQPLRTVPH